MTEMNDIPKDESAKEEDSGWALTPHHLMPAAAIGAALSNDVRKRMESLGAVMALTAKSPVIDMFGRQMASSAMAEVIKAAAPISDQLHAQVIEASNFAATIQEIIKPVIEAQRSFAEPLIRQIEEDEQYADEIGPYFEDAGLWFSGGMPLSLWIEVKRLYNDGGLTVSALKELVLDVYHSNDYEYLETIVGGWWDHPEFTNWKRHIRSALDSHRQGEFVLSVPVLALVCEDLMRKASGRQSTNMKKLSEAIEEMLSEWSLSAVSEQPLAAALKRLSKPGGLLDPIPSSEPDRWHRPRILHGRDPDYDTPVNSLRFFILLDELHNLISERDRSVG